MWDSEQYPLYSTSGMEAMGDAMREYTLSLNRPLSFVRTDYRAPSPVTVASRDVEGRRVYL